MCKFILFTVGLISIISVRAQYYDTNYVDNLSHKIFLAYFQEYSNSTLHISPVPAIDAGETETLLLQSDINLFSGLLLQYKSTSIYIAGNTPQTTESIAKFGVQSYQNWSINYNKSGLFAKINSVRQTGFSDANFESHTFYDSTETSFQRYQNLSTNWLSFDFKFYPGYRQFAQGIPSWFGLIQKKSKFSFGYKIAYNYLKINNDETALFSDSLAVANDLYTLNQSVYNGVTLAVAPSIYLVAKARYFAYADVWAGVDLNRTKLRGATFASRKFGVGFVLPEFRLALGYQNQRWLFALYNSYTNQQFQSEGLNTNLAYNKFGIIIGLRFHSPARLAF